MGAYFLLYARSMIWYSKVGKQQIRKQLLGLVPWRGDEMVLDVGCGRGLVMIGAAKQLITGKAIGFLRTYCVRGSKTLIEHGN